MDTNRQTIAYFWRHIRTDKKRFFIALVCIPAAALMLDTLLPYFLAQAIGGLTQSNQEMISQSLVAAGIVAAIGIVLNFVGFQTLVRHEAGVRVRLSDWSLSTLLHKDYDFFSNQKVGALTSRYIDFVRAHLGLQDLLIIRTLTFLISVSVGLIIVGLQAPTLALVLLGLIILLLVEVRLGLKYRESYRHARKKMVGELNGLVADVLTNNLIVKTFATESAEEKTISYKNKQFADVYIKDFSILGGEGSLRLAIMSLTQIIAISIVASLVLSQQLTIALAIFSLAYLQRIASQLFNLGDILNGYDRVLLEAAPMTNILRSPSTIVDEQNATNLHVSKGTIHLQNISYTYADSDESVITDVNLHIIAGQKIGLVGHSGSGKTTLTRLLLRFADLNAGKITIDDQDIKAVTQESLRRHISYVPQEPMLFHRSLRENIAYAHPDASEEHVRQAATKANAMEFIESLPQGLDTVVGERGVKLSGGQRQRVAIARAILKDAPILVLDEATSALDSESEKLIQASLNYLMKGRTAIVIAHRLSTIQKMDRIIVLDGGKIVEDGSHAELLAHKGTYARLWAHQSGGFIED